jgi:hypothetical protein
VCALNLIQPTNFAASYLWIKNGLHGCRWIVVETYGIRGKKEKKNDPSQKR